MDSASGRFVALALAFLLALPALARAEVIRRFESEIRVEDPATLVITETIEMDFEQTPRRGIFRVIPYRYERYNNAWRIDIRIDSVTNERGQPRPYTVSRQGGDLSVRIGDPNRYVTGRHTYVIRYTARRALNFFSGEPEVYWNATGDEWPFPIEQATARLILPEGVSVDETRVRSFAGPPGSTAAGQVSLQGGEVIYGAQMLRPGSGLTIVARLPEGSVARASFADDARWWLRDWWPAVVLPPLSLAGMFALWRWRGRDIGGGQAIAVEWDPPEGLSPAEVGTLVDEVCHSQDIIATIIDLAARGHLKIERLEGEGFLAFSKGDWRFRRLSKPADWPKLLPHERDMMEAIFESEDSPKLSELRGKFHTHFARIRGDIYKSLARRGFFTGDPQRVRAAYFGAGVMIAVGGVALAVVFGKIGVLAWGVGAIVASLPVLGFAFFMPARTLKGSTALRECRGFRRFLVMVERERLAEAYRQDPTVFGRLLPYAMVLGVEDRWATQFEGLLDRPPEWFDSGSQTSFVPTLFLADLGRSVSSMSTNLSAQPASSGAGGGSSGFSAGGGFSGGGFGGGGGGSW